MNKVNNVILRDEIEKKIDEIGEFYNENKAVILTETDLQCILYQKLLEIESLRKIKKTNNDEDFRTHSVHTEISWFDDKGRLTMKPDISLIDPSNITIENGRQSIKMPTKGFYFIEGGIIFELKFNRNRSCTKFLNEIKKDFEKFKKLKQLNDEIFCYFVVFNKRDNKNKDFEEFLIRNASSSTHKLIHKSANI